jgi:hypothetical protein
MKPSIGRIATVSPTASPAVRAPTPGASGQRLSMVTSCGRLHRRAWRRRVHPRGRRPPDHPRGCCRRVHPRGWRRRTIREAAVAASSAGLLAELASQGRGSGFIWPGVGSTGGFFVRWRQIWWVPAEKAATGGGHPTAIQRCRPAGPTQMPMPTQMPGPGPMPGPGRGWTGAGAGQDRGRGGDGGGLGELGHLTGTADKIFSVPGPDVVSEPPTPDTWPEPWPEPWPDPWLEAWPTPDPTPGPTRGLAPETPLDPQS